MVLEKTLESPLAHKEIQSVHPKGELMSLLYERSNPWAQYVYSGILIFFMSRF